MMMKRDYCRPSVELFEVASEKGFVQSGFDSGFVVPGGGNNGGDDDWAYQFRRVLNLIRRLEI